MELTILCCVPGRDARTAIERGAGGRCRIIAFDRLVECQARVEIGPPDLVIVDLDGEPHAAARALVAALRRASPATYIIGLVSYARTRGSEMAALVRDGLDAVSLRESGSLAADVEHAIVVASRPSALLRLAESIDASAGLHPLAASVVKAAVSATSWPNVAQVSRSLGISARELQRRFSDAQLGVPFDLLQITRWVLAGAALRSTTRDQRQVAATLGFATVGAMRDALRRSMGLTLDEFRREGVADSLRSRLSDRFSASRPIFPGSLTVSNPLGAYRNAVQLRDQPVGRRPERLRDDLLQGGPAAV